MTVNVMRSNGQALTEQGFIEIDLGTGSILWANDFFCKTLGYKLEQITKFLIFDLAPDSLRDPISMSVSDRMVGTRHHYCIWPFKAPDDSIVWWYTMFVKSEDSVFWFRTDFLNRTPTTGTEYLSLVVSMNTINDHNEFRSHFDVVTKANEDRIVRVEADTHALKSGMENFMKLTEQSISASRSAASETLKVRSEISELRSEMRDGMASQTVELIRLMTNDSAQNLRIESYEKQLRESTEKIMSQAMSNIDDKGRLAAQNMNMEAANAGNTIGKRVSIPIGVISIVSTVIQFIIAHYMQK